MGQGIPPAPPEAEVIRLARKAVGLTAEDAAAASKAHDSTGKGVSATYWRDVERGHGGRRGQQVATRASDRILAAMARVVSVLPAQLTAAGREDAARVLEEILRREAAPAPPRRSSLPQPTEAMARDMALFSSVVEGCANTAMAAYPGQRLSGRQVFPDSPAAPAWWPAARAYWDAAAGEGVRLEDIPETVVTLLAWRTQLDRGERENGRATGLMHRPALVALR